MAIKEAPNSVPKKFRSLNKSFIDSLLHDNNSFFMSFPANLSFIGKEKNENVILIVRSHWIIYFPYIFIGIIIFILTAVITSLTQQISQNVTLLVSTWIMSILTSLSIFVYAYIRWFYNVNIITDKRVIDLDFTSLLSHTSSEARLDKIEDVTHKQIGLISSIFDIGTLYIQTAGAKAEIEFDYIPRPRDVQDILYDLLDSKHEGKI